MKSLIKHLGVLGLALAGVLSSTTPASADDFCGIDVGEVWYHCEYKAAPWEPTQTRFFGPCENGDTVVLSVNVESACGLNSGVITATAIHPTGEYNMANLWRPRFVRFMRGGVQTVRIKMEGVYYGTTNPEQVVTSIPIQITPVSAQNALITDDYLVWIWWTGTLYTDGGGKG